jgi:hypothetical protein
MLNNIDISMAYNTNYFTIFAKGNRIFCTPTPGSKICTDQKKKKLIGGNVNLTISISPPFLSGKNRK